ncbi:glycosyltransferase family 4 protein [Aquisphaera insulae]|uniref:glycosyltransferase family 4 protein n=1 Tax=Aquisphaera insulae TaxID=2712864 RepID=UPI0013ED2B1A|nr:glycosyltransferase family 4 protein [Aquisphaera insulae]
MRLALNFSRIDPSKGGAETYVIDLCRSLVRAGHDVDVYAESWQPGALPPEVRPIKVAVKGTTRSGRIWSFARNSAAAINPADYDCTVGFINTYAHDVIIPQGGVHAGSLRANAQRFRNPVLRRLYILGKRLNPKFTLYRAIERRQYAARRRAQVVAVSEMVRRHVQEFQGVPRERIHVIPNAIDVGRVHLDHPGAVRCAFRNRLALEPDDVVGLFVGHNFALKGLRPLLKALARRHGAGGRPIHLLVSGGGRVEAYRRRAKALGLGDAVHFLGYHPDIRECYAASDFFVLPSYYDPCSLVVLEALAFGLPVITSKQNGAGELIAEGREGFVVAAPDAIDELAAALDAMADEARRSSMAAAAAKLGAVQTFDRHVEALVRVFETVAAARAGHGSHGEIGGARPHSGLSRERKPARS